MTDPQTTHAPGCWGWGPKHYECAVREIERLEKRLSAYQAAVNKIDDLIEYSLPMPSGTKAALYAVLANLTATIAVELTSD